MKKVSALNLEGENLASGCLCECLEDGQGGMLSGIGDILGCGCGCPDPEGWDLYFLTAITP